MNMEPDRGIMGVMGAYKKWIFGGLVVVALSILLLVLFGPGKSAPVTPGEPVMLPSVNSTDPSLMGGSTGLSVNGKLGTVVMLDFLNNGTTAADLQNPGMYYVAGSPGYCLSDGTCPHGAAATDFNIAYDARAQFFNIALLGEPLGKVRAEAEQLMIKILGISQDQLCTLNYYVGTTYYVNEQYSGKNLGFSFCPGATVLP